MMGSDDDQGHRIWLLLERIHDTHNLGAMMRTALFFGVERVLLHDCARPTPAVARASAGAAEWLDVHLLDDPAVTAAVAQAAGWDVVGTDALPSDRSGGSGGGHHRAHHANNSNYESNSNSSSGEVANNHDSLDDDNDNDDVGGSVPLERAVLTRPTIVCFGKEGDGLRKQTLAACNFTVGIPRRGPSVAGGGRGGRRRPLYELDSLNVSVSCGVVLAALTSTPPHRAM